MVKAVARPVLRRILLVIGATVVAEVVNDDCVVLGLAAAVTVEGALDVVVEVVMVVLVELEVVVLLVVVLAHSPLSS